MGLSVTPRLLLISLCGLVFSGTLQAQWGTQGSPFPVDSPEVSTQIKARDIGDSRLTVRYYEVSSAQGDLFVNVVATNFVGDVDFFIASNLKPLAKITVLGSDEPWETGRVIYFREEQKVLMRIEGRTPNDDIAVLRIKFAGSFRPSERRIVQVETDPPARVAVGGERVSSVGGTLAEKPKGDPAEVKPNSAPKEKKPTASPAVTASKSDPRKSDPKSDPAAKSSQSPSDAAVKPTQPPVQPPAKSEPKSAVGAKRSEPVKAETTKRAVVRLKDGRKLSLPMTDVVRVSVEEGVLVITQKSGSLLRLPLSDVEEFSIK